VADLSVSNVTDIEGNLAHDAADSGHPVKIGGYASNAIPAAVSADGDRVNARFTQTGALNVYMVDQSGAAASLGGGTQYAVDAALGATPTGTLAIAARDDALSALTPVEGDAVGLRVGDKGALWVQISDGSGNQITSFGGGTQYAEDVALSTVGSATGTIAMGRASASAPTAVSADNDAASLWVSRSGALNVILRDTSGAAITSGVQYTEDSALGTNGQGTLVLARRDDALSTLTPVADDAVGLRVGDKGALWVQIADGSGNQVTSFGGGTQYVGDTAATSTPTGTMAMGRASAAAPTAVSADDDAVALWALRNGSQVVNLASGGSLVTVGQKASAASLPVVLASDQSALAVTGTFWQATQPVSGTVTANAGTGPWPVTDNAGSLTVDSPGIPTALGQSTMANSMRVVVASDQSAVPVTGTFWQATQPVSVAGTLAVAGPTAADAALTASPQTIGARASSALPTAMSADGDVVNVWANRSGALVTAQLPHLGRVGDPYTHTAKTVQYTSTQTGAAVWTPGSGKKLVITAFQIQAGGTTAGTMQLWFGASGDTSYTRGTDLAIFDGEFAPSTTLKPGVVQTGLWIASAADHVLRVTDSAAINPLTVTVWGYEI